MGLTRAVRHIASLMGICLIIGRKHCSPHLNVKISRQMLLFVLICTVRSIFPLRNHYRQRKLFKNLVAQNCTIASFCTCAEALEKTLQAGSTGISMLFLKKGTSILTWVLRTEYVLYTPGMPQHMYKDQYKDMYKDMSSYKHNCSYTSTCPA